MAITKDPEPVDDAIHAWASNSDRFPNDQCLRRHGFGIWQRKRGQPAIWRWQGLDFTEAEAMAEVKDSVGQMVAKLVKA